jgi:hypothetical protein
MATQLTYLIAPNHRFRAHDGPIRLGYLIADPTRPHRALSELPDSTLKDKYPQIERVPETKHDVTRGAGSSLGGSVFARFAQVVKLEISGSKTSERESSYTMDGLQTEYFLKDPDDTEIQSRISEPRVKSYMQPKPWLPRKPVYMVSGIMIAQGLVLRSSRNESQQGSANAGGTAPTPAGGLDLGAGVSGHRATSDFDEHHIAVDIVFAYQLLKIRYKTLSSKVDMDEFRPKDGFQGVDEPQHETEDGDATIETTTATSGDLENLDGNLDHERVILDDGRELLMLSFPEKP